MNTNVWLLFSWNGWDGMLGYVASRPAYRSVSSLGLYNTLTESSRTTYGIRLGLFITIRDLSQNGWPTNRRVFEICQMFVCSRQIPFVLLQPLILRHHRYRPCTAHTEETYGIGPHRRLYVWPSPVVTWSMNMKSLDWVRGYPACKQGGMIIPSNWVDDVTSGCGIQHSTCAVPSSEFNTRSNNLDSFEHRQLRVQTEHRWEKTSGSSRGVNSL